MSENSRIEWTDHTFNPWWGCTKVSPGCTACYAETWAKRFGVAWGDAASRRVSSDAVWAQPLRWDRKAAKAGRRARVFCASMADVFEARDDLDPVRERLWALIEATPHLDWLLLTKRPEELVRRAPSRWANGWPANVWAGTTVEDQRRADERIPHLLRVPARVRFLSCEPLLGPLNLRIENRVSRCQCEGGSVPVYEYGVLTGGSMCPTCGGTGWLPGIHWVIAGGESGRKARPSHPDWFRGLRDQCIAAGVPFFFKQWGEWAPGEAVEANGTDWHGMYEQDPRDGGAPRHHWPDAPVRETAARLGRPVEHDGAIAGDAEVLRIGKHAAGRLLDGREWSEVPS